MHGNTRSGIVGGDEAIPHSHPHQVALIIDNSYFCGGSLICEFLLYSFLFIAFSIYSPKYEIFPNDNLSYTWGLFIYVGIMWIFGQFLISHIQDWDHVEIEVIIFW